MRQRNFVLVFSTYRKVVHNQKIVKPFKHKVNDPAVNTAFNYINSLGQVDYNLDQPHTKEFNKNINSLSYQKPYKLLREVKGKTQDKLKEIQHFKRSAQTNIQEYLELFDKKVTNNQVSYHSEICEPIGIIH